MVDDDDEDDEDEFVFGTCLFSSLLARIFRFRGCKSTVFCELSLVDEVDEADGLGTFVVSVSELMFGLLGLLTLAPTVLDVVDDVLGLALSFDSAVTDDAGVFVVETVVVVLGCCVTGAGEGELLCSCGEELLELRSTDEPPRFELRKTRCCFWSSFVSVVLSFLSSTLFVESDGLVQRDDALSLSAESLLFDDDATTYGSAALFRVDILLPLRVPIS